MLTSFNSEQYIGLYKLSLLCDGFNLKKVHNLLTDFKKPHVSSLILKFC